MLWATADIEGIEIPQRSDLSPHRLVAAKEVGSGLPRFRTFQVSPKDSDDQSVAA
jgi:hypothetical protein